MNTYQAFKDKCDFALLLVLVLTTLITSNANAASWLSSPYDGSYHEYAIQTDNAGMLKQCPKVVFFKRKNYTKPFGHATLPVFDNLQYGCEICIYDPKHPESAPKVIFSAEDGQIFDMSLSYDAQKLLFSYRTSDISNNYHIYEINIDGTKLRQVTDGPYTDVAAQYLGNERIVFTSTRTKAYAMCQPHEVSALHTARMDGTDIRRIHFGTLADTSPFVMADSRIMFTRWEYMDKDVCLQQALWTINPDGTRVELHYGNTITNPAVIWQGKEIPGTLLSVVTMCAHHGHPVGAIGILDYSKGVENPASLRCITTDIKIEPTTDPYTKDGDKQRVWAYRDPWPISKDLFLCAYGGPEKDGPKRYRLFLLNDKGQKVHLYGDKRVDCFNPIAVTPRTPPGHQPAIAESDQNFGTFFVQDMYQGALSDLPRGTVKELRIMSQVQKECNMLDPRAYGHGPVISMGSTYYVKRCYGTVPVTENGTAYFKAPAGVELYFQAIDKDGKELIRMGTLTQLMPGENQSCIGCHEYRIAPPMEIAAKAMQRLQSPPSEITPPPWGESGNIDFVKHVQPVFDKYCVSCHSGKNPKGRVDLSNDKTIFFNMAYSNLLGEKGSRRAKRDPLKNSRIWWTDGDWGGQTGNYKPLVTGSRMSGITKMIEEGHGDVNVDDNSRRRIYNWIDAHVPYYGTYDHVRPKEQGRRFFWPKESFARFRRIVNKNCASCHGKYEFGSFGTDTIKESWANLTNPEFSKALNAHLDSDAGGWGLSKPKDGKTPPLMKDKNDPLYQSMLKEIVIAKDELIKKPRIDMPNAKPVPYERKYNNRYIKPKAKPMR